MHLRGASAHVENNTSRTHARTLPTSLTLLPRSLATRARTLYREVVAAVGASKRIRFSLGALILIIISLFIFLRAGPSKWRAGTLLWRAAFGRTPLPTPAYIPGIIIPTAAGRGAHLATLFNSLFAVGAPNIRRLIIVDTSNSAPDVACALEAVTARVPVSTKFEILRPTPRVDAFLSVSEAWNAAAELLLEREHLPWTFVLNDDVSFSPQSLHAASASVWARHHTHAVVFANSDEPGIIGGNIFSAYALTRLGFLAVGRFDENFFPAYYEDCDWFYRLKLLGLRWYVERAWEFVHPAPITPPTEAIRTCMEARPASAHAGAIALAHTMRLFINATTNGTIADGHREYYIRKWGSFVEECAGGDFEHPFNDATFAVADWEFDRARRQRIIAQVQAKQKMKLKT